MTRSQRILLAIGIIAMVALAAPSAWRAWQEHHLTDGKTLVYGAASNRTSIDLAMCLMKREPGALTLDIASQNHFTDAARGAVVEVARQGDKRSVRAWLPAGQPLRAGEKTHLDGCVADADAPGAAS